MHQTDRQYVHELDGMGYRMPVVFGCFTVSALALMGVPGLAGFISKWNLAAAAVESGIPLAYAGVGCLLVSALLTAIYMLTIVVRAYFPDKFSVQNRSKDPSEWERIHDPDWKMLLPLCVFVVFIVYFGLHSAPVTAFLTQVSLSVY